MYKIKYDILLVISMLRIKNTNMYIKIYSDKMEIQSLLI